MNTKKGASTDETTAQDIKDFIVVELENVQFIEVHQHSNLVSLEPPGKGA